MYQDEDYYNAKSRKNGWDFPGDHFTISVESQTEGASLEATTVSDLVKEARETIDYLSNEISNLKTDIEVLKAELEQPYQRGSFGLQVKRVVDSLDGYHKSLLYESMSDFSNLTMTEFYNKAAQLSIMQEAGKEDSSDE